MSILVILAVVFTGGIGVGLAFPAPGWAAVVAAVCGTGATSVSLATRRCTALTLFSVVFALGWVRPQDEPEPISDDLVRPCVRLLEGRVVSPPVSLEDRQRLVIDLTRWSTCVRGPASDPLGPAVGRVYLTVKQRDGLSCRRKELIWLRAALKPITEHRNPGTAGRTSESRAFSAVISRDDVLARIESSSSSLRHGFDVLRDDLAVFWLRALPKKQASLARALTLGESMALDYDDRERFRRTGAAHLLSVSGLHLGLSVLFVYWLARRLLLCNASISSSLDVGRIAALLAIPAAISFTLLTGCRTPVVRACVMATSALAARASGRTAGTLEALAISAIALLCHDPKELLEPGFQLSFSAVIGFFLVRGKDTARSDLDLHTELVPPHRLARLGHHVRRSAISLLRSTAAACAATTPLVLAHFGYVSLVAVPVNLIAVPLTGLAIMPCLLLVMSLAGPAPRLAELLCPIAGGLLTALDRFLEMVSTLPCTLETPGPLLGGAVVAFSASAMLLVARMPRPGVATLATGVLLASLSSLVDPPRFPKGKLTIDILDVGQGDSALITFPGGRHFLVDAGGTWSGRFDVGERVVVPTLRALGVRRVEAVVVTHPDFDHMGGMQAVLNAVEVGELWENGQGEAEGAGERYDALLETARRKGITVRRTPDICGRTEVDGVELNVIHPCQEDGGYDPMLSFNDNSLVLIVRYGLVVVALIGDIEDRVEEMLAENGAIPHVDVLKLSHHGSKTSSSELLLDAATPYIGIASLGQRRTQDTPHREVKERLLEREIHLFRTDLDGAIRVVTDGRLLQVSKTIR